MKETPRNQDGEAPTTNPSETEERLEEKEREGVGGANRERIDAKIKSLES